MLLGVCSSYYFQTLMEEDLALDTEEIPKTDRNGGKALGRIPELDASPETRSQPADLVTSREGSRPNWPFRRRTGPGEGP